MYNPTVWQAGDIISASLLNHLEGGVVEANNLLPTATENDLGNMLIVSTIIEDGAVIAPQQEVDFDQETGYAVLSDVNTVPFVEGAELHVIYSGVSNFDGVVIVEQDGADLFAGPLELVDGELRLMNNDDINYATIYVAVALGERCAYTLKPQILIVHLVSHGGDDYSCDKSAREIVNYVENGGSAILVNRIGKTYTLSEAMETRRGYEVRFTDIVLSPSTSRCTTTEFYLLNDTVTYSGAQYDLSSLEILP